MSNCINNLYDNYYKEDFEYYYPYSFFNSETTYLYSNNPCRVEIPFGNNYDVPIQMDSYILVEENSIVYYCKGEEPTEDTEGKVGTRAYNVADLRSWSCTAIEKDGNKNVYTWVEDEVFTFSNMSPIIVELPEYFYVGKTANIIIYNFRYEKIYETTQEAHKKMEFNITKEIAQEYFDKKGLYHLQVDLLDGDDISTMILPANFVIAII